LAKFDPETAFGLSF